MNNKEQKFRALLDEHHIWPTKYTFKFIILSENIYKIKEKIDIEFEIRKSSNGKYSSISFEVIANSSQEIIDIYNKLKGVDGLISL